MWNLLLGVDGWHRHYSIVVSSSSMKAWAILVE